MVSTRRGTRISPGKNANRRIRKKKKASPKKVKRSPNKAKKSPNKAKNAKKKTSKKKIVKKQTKSYSKKENKNSGSKTKLAAKKNAAAASKKRTMKKSPTKKKSPVKKKFGVHNRKKSPTKKKSPKKQIVKKKTGAGKKQLKLTSRMKASAKSNPVKKSKSMAVKKNQQENQLSFPKIKANHRFQFDFRSNHLTSEEYYILSEIYDIKINTKFNKNANILKLIGNVVAKSNLTQKIKNEIKHFLGNSYDYEDDWPFLQKDDIYIKSRFLDAMYVIKEADFFEQNPNHEAMKKMEKMFEEEFGNFTESDPTQYFFV